MLRILWLLGIGPIILGGLSGVALFLRAITARDKTSEETGRGTLWGLFLLCFMGGLALIIIVYNAGLR